MQFAEMIDRKVVKELNGRIVKSASEKVGLLTQKVRVRSEMKLQQWEQRKLELTHEDVQDLTKELQLLRVTKSLQNLIKVGGHDSKSLQEVKALERKMEMCESNTESDMVALKRQLAKLRVKTRAQEMANGRLDVTVKQLEETVQARVEVSNLAANKERASQVLQTSMKSISERSQLIIIADAQKEEIRKLKLERDRLRNKTFPSFVQALSPRQGNIDLAAHQFLSANTGRLPFGGPTGGPSPRARRGSPRASVAGHSPRTPHMPQANAGLGMAGMESSPMPPPRSDAFRGAATPGQAKSPRLSRVMAK